ncbi:hypothetical protein CSC75_05660 [Pseudoxanthomonas wuyuanensis]|nr:hypothetical protein CSC75_05660 [Pseudoxanthomonas wuyuanensis]
MPVLEVISPLVIQNFQVSVLRYYSRNSDDFTEHVISQKGMTENCASTALRALAGVGIACFAILVHGFADAQFSVQDRQAAIRLPFFSIEDLVVGQGRLGGRAFQPGSDQTDTLLPLICRRILFTFQGFREFHQRLCSLVTQSRVILCGQDLFLQFSYSVFGFPDASCDLAIVILSTKAPV